MSSTPPPNSPDPETVPVAIGQNPIQRAIDRLMPGWLPEAVRAVPAVKYALGVAAIAAFAALAASFAKNPAQAMVMVAVMIVGMVVLRVFSALSESDTKEFRLPALVLLWFSIGLFCIGTLVAASHFVFGVPKFAALAKEDPNHGKGKSVSGPPVKTPDPAVKTVGELLNGLITELSAVIEHDETRPDEEPNEVVLAEILKRVPVILRRFESIVDGKLSSAQLVEKHYWMSQGCLHLAQAQSPELRKETCLAGMASAGYALQLLREIKSEPELSPAARHFTEALYEERLIFSRAVFLAIGVVDKTGATRREIEDQLAAVEKINGSFLRNTEKPEWNDFLSRVLNLSKSRPYGAQR